jgi:hypothetical protein
MLGTLTSCQHREDGPRVQRDHHKVYDREQGEQAESNQMDRPGAIVPTEEAPQPLELHRLVDRQSGEHFGQSNHNDGAVRQALQTI